MKPMIIVQPGQGGGIVSPPKSNWMQAASTSPPVAGPGPKLYIFNVTLTPVSLFLNLCSSEIRVNAK